MRNGNHEREAIIPPLGKDAARRNAVGLALAISIGPWSSLAGNDRVA
jgi:hypothetical protein